MSAFFRSAGLLRGRLKPSSVGYALSDSFPSEYVPLVVAVAGATLLGSYCCIFPVAHLISNDNDNANRIPSTCHTTPATHSSLWKNVNKVQCEQSLQDERDVPSGMSEPVRFYQCLEFHRYLLPQYLRWWQGSSAPDTIEDTNIQWPRNIPTEDEIPSLEMDFTFCQKTSFFVGMSKACQDLKFRIASYYVFQDKALADRIKGYRMVKELAESGHPDSMCLFGTLCE
jgi:hypothetical protein